ncbi:unnamed protein product, partial [Pocillopora meandrina]
ELHIPCHEFIRRDRNRHGGGVGFYIKSSNSYIVHSGLNLFSSNESFIGKLDSLDLEYHLLGGLNCNLVSPTPDASTHRLLEISDLYGLKQLINEPTRVTESSSTLIDLIYTNYADRACFSGVSHIAISDHSLVYVYRKISSDLPSKGHSSISYRNFRNL